MAGRASGLSVKEHTAPFGALGQRRPAAIAVSNGLSSARHSKVMKSAITLAMSVKRIGAPAPSTAANISRYSGISATRSAIRTQAPVSPVRFDSRTDWETSFSE